MDTNRRDGRKTISHSARCWDTWESMLQGLSFGTPQCLLYATFLRPPPAPLPTPASLGSANSYHAPFLQGAPSFFFFFLFLEDPETEVDGTRMGHGLKQRKEKEDETEMPTRPAHVGARHDTRCTQVGTATLLSFV